MSKVSVIIPARNERYLVNTVRDVFAKAQGDIEAVVILDGGNIPAEWPALQSAHTNLHTVHWAESRGMRPGINAGVASAISRGAKFIGKFDAHCLFGEGFDVKLAADCADNWIVVPRRKRLDAENWTIQETGKLDIDYHYLSFPDNPDDFGGPGLNGKVWEQRIRERLGKSEFDLDEEMSSQGSGWFMRADYFQYLELMDDANYGKFWNEFQELGLKSWLSGGQVMVNKRTWYAHLHKGRTYKGADGKGGRGYHLPESWLKQGAGFTWNWIWNDAAFNHKQTRPFEWLIDHFWPVPTWKEDWRDVLYKDRKPRMVGIPQAKEVITTSDDIGEKVEGAQPSLRILSARYGILSSMPPFTDHSIDVVDQVRLLVKNNSLDIVVNNSTLAPGQNPFRGKKKVLLLTYAYGDSDQVTVERTEKDWLIIGQAQRVRQPLDVVNLETAALKLDEGQVVRVPPGLTIHPYPEEISAAQSVGQEAVKALDDFGKVAGSLSAEVRAYIADGRSLPMSATALNDYLIRKFQIPAQRLRGPMPIEVPTFHRNDLAQLFAELGFQRGAEIGVAEGNYSKVLLEANPDCHLLLVDPWHAYSDNPQNKSKDKHEFAYNETKRKAVGYSNVKLDMRYSMDAVRDVADSSLDWVYIDAHHSYPYVMPDIIFWSQKVRSGGIVAGDDVYKLNDKWGAGPMEAIYDYARAMKINPWWLIAAHKSVDFFFVKP